MRIHAHTFTALWLIGLVAYILAGTPLTPFHADESTQIYMSRDYVYQFIERDWSLVRYGNPPINDAEQRLRLLNGTINKYTIGLVWHLAGFEQSDLNEQWDWGADWDYNQHTGHAPIQELLLAARWPSAIMLAVGVVVMFVLGWALAGHLSALLASLYYTLNPALLLNGRRAMMEGSATLFGLLVVLMGVWYLRKPSWWGAALLGISAGLAFASKHSTVFAVAAVLGVVGVWSTVQTRRGQVVGWWLVAATIAALVFYLLNPAWWDNPIGRVGEVLRLRQELLDIQTDVFGGYTDIGDQVAGFLRQTLAALPQYYEAPGWDIYIGDQIARYEASVWRGVSIGGSLLGAVVLSGIIALGIWRLVHNKSISPMTRWMVGVWALAVTLSTLPLTPLEWQRYYLPVYPVIGLLGASGLSDLLRRLKR